MFACGTPAAASPGCCRWPGLGSDQARREDINVRQTDRPDGPEESITIDCDDCAVRGPGCRDCVISVLLGVPDMLLADERAALDVLADAGLTPRLRLVPIRVHPRPGVA